MIIYNQQQKSQESYSSVALHGFLYEENQCLNSPTPIVVTIKTTYSKKKHVEQSTLTQLCKTQSTRHGTCNGILDHTKSQHISFTLLWMTIYYLGMISHMNSGVTGLLVKKKLTTGQQHSY